MKNLPNLSVKANLISAYGDSPFERSRLDAPLEPGWLDTPTLCRPVKPEQNGAQAACFLSFCPLEVSMH